MFNKIKSFNIKGRRKPGRPFNTTTYPWRSTAIGRSFFLQQSTPWTGMRTTLKNEGIIFESTPMFNGFLMTRIK